MYARVLKAEWVFKKWTRAAWQASVESRRRAMRQNAANAESLTSKVKALGKDADRPTRINAINGHMAERGYLHAGKDKEGNHLFVPHSGDTDTPEPPKNPVIGHKVLVAYNPKTRTADAQHRY